MPTEFSFEEATQPAKSFTFEEATTPKSFSFEEAQTTTATTPQPSPLVQGINEQNKLAVETFGKAMDMLAIGAESGAIQGQRTEAEIRAVKKGLGELETPPTQPIPQAKLPQRATIGGEPQPIETYLGTPEERQVEFKQQALTPIVPIPKFTINADDSKTMAVGKSIVNFLTGIVEFAESPAGILAAPVAAAAPTATAALFTADMIHSVGNQATEMGLNWDQMTDAQKAAAVTDTSATGLLALALGTGAGRSIASKAKQGLETIAVKPTPKPSPSVTYRRPGEGIPFPKAGETRPEPQAVVPPTVMPFGIPPVVRPTVSEQRVTDETVFNEALARQQALQAEIAAKTLAPLTTAETSKTTEVPNARSITSTERIPGPQVRPGVDEGTSLRQQGETPVPQTEVLAPQTEKAVKEIVQPEDVSGSVLRKPAEVPSPQVQTGGIAQPPPPPPAQPVGTEAGKAVSESKSGGFGMPPIVSEMISTIQRAASDLTQRISNVKLAPYVEGQKFEAVTFELDGKQYKAELKGRNKDLVPGINPESDKGIALRAFLDGDAVELKPSQSPTPEPPASQKPSSTTFDVESEGKQMGLTPEQIAQAKAEGVTSALGLRRIEKNTRQPTPPAPTSEGKDLGPGLGAAKTGEVEVQGNPDIYGIANRVEAERAMALGVEPPPPGKGIAPADSVEHGRELLKQGRSAEGTLELFKKTKALSADDIAVVRAHGEDLAFKARKLEEKFGTDSDEYRAALKASTDWDAQIQPMKTAWSNIGKGMQGETDIDTGSFTGLARAHKRNTGEDFTPNQTKKAKEVSGKVRGAAEKAEEAKQNLLKDIDERTSLTAAEKRALDAANKTVRENAIRVADAENKTRVATTELERETAKIQEAAARKALKDAEDVAKAAAVKLAKAETKAREQRAAERPEAIQNKAAQDALKAANETVRKAAADLAKEENKVRVAKTVAEKDLANVAIKRAKQRLKEEQKRVRQAAIAAAKAEVKNRVNPELKVWEQIRKYIDQGEFDFDEVRNRVATDLGMSVEQVTKLLTKTPRTKYLANEMWRRQQDYARFKESAKAWLRGVETPEYHKWIGSVPKILFSLKVGFHGTVALGTHAPMVAFQPRFWKTYADNFLKMYHMVGSRAYHERQVQDLLRRKNYVTARRAGLVNDPSIFEDYNSPEVVKFLFTKLGDMGNRGYSILKILRQDMFDQMWDQLPQTTKTPEVAKAIADGLNHATGVVQVSAPKAAAIALFAPRLLGSRVMWLAGDPIRAADTMFRWKDATQAEKIFALNQIKEKLWVSGVMFSMLALNEGILQSTGSKQEVNFTNPFESDFLKFKVAGMNISYGNAMITMARLPLQLWVGLENEGKFNKITYEDENTAKTLFKYARSQASPFMALMLDLAFGRDYQERPLPRAGFGLLEGKKNVPKRLAAHGLGEPYTWPEYWSEQLAPIPFQEAIKEVWKTGLGMSDEQMTQFAKAMVTIAVMGGTGARVSEDYSIIGTPSSKNKR